MDHGKDFMPKQNSSLLGPVVAREPPFGPLLSELVEAGKSLQAIRIADSFAMPRTSFFCCSEIDTKQAPHGHTFTDFSFWSYRTRPFSACRFAALTLIGTDGVVLHDGAAIPDTVNHIMTWAPGSLIERYTPKAHLKLRNPGPSKVRAGDGPYFIGFTGSWRNYAHWLQESLPKLVTFLELSKQHSDLKLVLPPFDVESFQQNTLDLLGIAPAAVVTIEHTDIVEFQDVWMLTNADIWSVPPLVTQAASTLVSAAKLKGGTVQSRGERIYLHRNGGSRQVANFGAIKKLCEELGFEVVSFETKPLFEQIAIMQNANYVIGEHGAGLANILFCKKGTYVLELFNPVCVQPAFWSVASASELNFGFLVGTHIPTPNADVPNWNSSYDIPLDRLETAIKLVQNLPCNSLKKTTIMAAPPTKPKIQFTGPDQFEISGIKFALATAQAATTPERVLVYKDRGFVESYIETFSTISAKRAFEFGIYQGGSAIFLTSLLGIEKFVCVDISEPVEEFAQALARNGLDDRIKPYYGISQDSTDGIRDIMQAEFGDDAPDLIIDDASHLYAQTKQSFQIAFPYLKEGGHYIIEDWSWAHWPENQSATHGWNELPAMTNLVLELVLLLPSSDLIEWMTVRQGYVIIKKKASRHSSPILNIDDTLRIRGRHLAQI